MVRLGLVVAWLVLTGMKVDYFLSQPTILQPRVDREFEELPYITVIREEKHASTFLLLWSHVAESFRYETDYSKYRMIRKQSLNEFVRSHSMSLIELSGQSRRSLSEEERKLIINETTSETTSGKWSVTLTDRLDIGATLAMNSSSAAITLHRYTDFVLPMSDLIGRTKGYYRLIFHARPCFFRFLRDFHDEVAIENVTSIPAIELNILRMVKLNLRREPCEEDPAYEYQACIRECILNNLNCSLYGNDTGSGKPTCTVDDISEYFHDISRVDENDACRCQQPCIQDSISYSSKPAKEWQLKRTQSEFPISIDVNEVRHTTVMVLTYGLEDLLADMGGYLGLLLGASLLSVFGSGRKLIRRLVRQALAKRRRRRRQQEVKEEEEQHRMETTWSIYRDQEAFDGSDFVPVTQVHPDFYSRFVQSHVSTEE